MAVCAVLRMMMMMMVCVKGSSPRPDWSSKDTECVQMLKHLHSGARITVQMPPDIQGHWVSTSCEVRPGPEFITRSYRFLHNSSFSALQFYYSDVHCSSPTHTLLVRGRLRLRQASWIVRGGTEADYQIQSTRVVFHSESAAAALGLQLERGCRSISRSWRLNMSYELWSEEKDSECTAQINFSMHELQLLRLEKQHLEPALEELYLGDIHTQAEHRLTYRPSSYQPALHNARNHDGRCLVCRMVSRSDEFHPPVLPVLPVLPVVLQGQWASRRCEVRPEVQFLTRHFIFHDSNSSWEGHYYHYSDPACRHPTFSITARGAYSRGAESARISGATEYIFTVQQVCVLPLDVSTVSLLNLSPGAQCGVRGSWRLGEQQDVTATQGCAALGIRLPHTEFEIFRSQRLQDGRLLLFNGQRPSDGSSPDRPERRPSSFQQPLMQCTEQSVSGFTEQHQHQLTVTMVMLLFWSLIG
ncbi:protein APCDD1-like [Danio rerio]|uniref:Protein APCDD1 n=1 Tax=Danio rerio TaxID=7955 RepID=A0A8M9PH82_DANRE